MDGWMKKTDSNWFKLPAIWSKNGDCVKGRGYHSFLPSRFANRIYGFFSLSLALFVRKVSNVTIVNAQFFDILQQQQEQEQQRKKNCVLLTRKKALDTKSSTNTKVWFVNYVRRCYWCLQAHFICLTIALKSIWWNKIVIWHIDKDHFEWVSMWSKWFQLKANSSFFLYHFTSNYCEGENS